jgi:hypothetical protein
MDLIFLLSLASGLIVIIFIVALFKQRSIQGTVKSARCQTMLE